MQAGTEGRSFEMGRGEGEKVEGRFKCESLLKSVYALLAFGIHRLYISRHYRYVLLYYLIFRSNRPVFRREKL